MSNAYLTWATRVRGIRPTDRTILLLIADKVAKDGIWQINIKDLAEDAELSRNTVRASLDRLARRALLAFKMEAYRGGAAQGAHRFILLRDEQELRDAASLGFTFQRQSMTVRFEQDEGSEFDPPPGQILTDGGSTGCPRVGQLLDPHIDPQNTPQNTTPIAPSSNAGPIDGGGGGGASASPRDGSAIVEPSETDRLWSIFNETYPPDILDPVEPARQHFRSLPPGDQEAAVRLLPRYLAEHARRKRSGQHVGRLRWLKEHRWEGLLRTEAPRTIAASGDGGSPAAAPIDPDPVLDFPGGFKRRESFVIAAIAKWRERPSSWPMTELGAPPGVPGCQVPRRLLQDPVSVLACEPAECAT